MKNEANLNNRKFTPTPYNIGGYNDFHPKTQNGTKPNEANLKPISEMENPRLPKDKKNGKRTQFRQPNSTATSCYKETYNALQPKRNEPKRTQLKPIKANFKISKTRFSPFMRIQPFRSFEFWLFVFVSYFDIRISYLGNTPRRLLGVVLFTKTPKPDFILQFRV